MASPKTDDRKATSAPLCREPWQNYYILRRGVLPCCYGHKAIGPMADWQTGWNSPELQEIRSYLAKGELSPYCLLSLSCPIVQLYLRDHPEAATVPEPEPAPVAPSRPLVLRVVNRLLGGVPGRIYRRLRGETPEA
jgi:hypothetical protein